MDRTTIMVAHFVGLVVLAGAMGCLKRRERIDIARDGSVKITVMYKGSPEDFQTEDALPLAAGGWEVTTVVDGADEEPKQTLIAKRRFAPGAALPSSFAKPGDPDADLRLAFPTKVVVEPRERETIFHFERTYSARPWAYVQYWKDRILEDPEVSDYKQQAVEELSKEARFEIVEALLGAAALQEVELARSALQACGVVSLRRKLDARRAMLDVYQDKARIEQIIVSCAGPESEERDACFEQAVAELVRDSKRALLAVMESDGVWSDKERIEFERCLERSKTQYAITEQVGGHAFEIIVELPGSVIAHNGDSLEYDKTRDTSLVKWEFDGGALRDRPHSLAAVSRIAHD